MLEKERLTALKVSGWQRSLPVEGCRFVANRAYAANPIIVDNFVFVVLPYRLLVINEL